MKQISNSTILIDLSGLDSELELNTVVNKNLIPESSTALKRNKNREELQVKLLVVEKVIISVAILHFKIAYLKKENSILKSSKSF